MVLAKTGSPLAVAILYILIPVATLVTDVWAGSLIDRLNKRTLMITLDNIRACLIFCLPFVDSLFYIKRNGSFTINQQARSDMKW